MALGFLLLVRVEPSFAADVVTAKRPSASAEGVPSEWAGKDKHPFLKSPKPPFPYSLLREVTATRDMKYNAIVKLTIDHGKIVAVPMRGKSRPCETSGLGSAEVLGS